MAVFVLDEGEGVHLGPRHDVGVRTLPDTIQHAAHRPLQNAVGWIVRAAWIVTRESRSTANLCSGVRLVCLGVPTWKGEGWSIAVVDVAADAGVGLTGYRAGDAEEDAWIIVRRWWTDERRAT